jgi:SAM-dependent methyltransferase
MDFPYEDVVRSDILRMIPSDGAQIGSIGCGSGATEQQLVSAGRQVHGVDVNPLAIEKAAPRLTTARLIAPDDRNPFPPDSLDGLILADVIEHLPAAWDALQSYARAVRPGGWIVISVPNMRNMRVLWTFMIRGDWPENPTGIFDATHLQVISRRRLDRWFAHAGIVPEQWFDLYLTRGAKQAFLRTFDRVTFRAFHEWMMMQHQVRCRKPA